MASEKCLIIQSNVTHLLSCTTFYVPPYTSFVLLWIYHLLVGGWWCWLFQRSVRWWEFPTSRPICRVSAASCSSTLLTRCRMASTLLTDTTRALRSLFSNWHRYTTYKCLDKGLDLGPAVHVLDLDLGFHWNTGWVGLFTLCNRLCFLLADIRHLWVIF